MMDLASMAASAGTGFLAGYILGYSLRRAASFLLVLLGMFILGLFALVAMGLATVNFAGISSLIEQLFVTGIQVGSPLLSSFGGPAFSVPFTLGLMGGGLRGATHSLGRRRRVLR
jgi:uncharacterized membrane protein (Fun14 family)